jgi:hypothetical protein
VVARSNAGSWLGETALDGATRLHAFHHVTNRDMAVVVAANWAEVMAPASSLAAGAHTLALIASAVIVIIGGAVLGELYRVRGNKRQKRILERNRNELQRLREAEVGLASRAALNAARLQAVVNGATDGVALFDSGLRLVQWNHPFARGIGVVLRTDMPLHALLRDQGAAGLFDPTPQPESEVARRIEVLREGQPEGLPQPGPDNEALILRGLPVEEGGFMLILNGLRHWEPAPAPAPMAEMESPAIVEPIRAPVPLW